MTPTANLAAATFIQPPARSFYGMAPLAAAGQLLAFPAPLQPPRTAPVSSPDVRIVGVKYHPDRSLADIKRCIRQDLDLLTSWPGPVFHVTARKGTGSMCRPDVTIVAEGLPFTCLHPEKRAVLERDGNDNRYHGFIETDEARAMRATLQGIADSYGFHYRHSYSRAFNVDVKLPQTGDERAAAVAVYRARVGQ